MFCYAVGFLLCHPVKCCWLSTNSNHTSFMTCVSLSMDALLLWAAEKCKKYCLDCSCARLVLFQHRVILTHSLHRAGISCMLCCQKFSLVNEMALPGQAWSLSSWLWKMATLHMIDEYQWNKEQQQPAVIYEILQSKMFSWNDIAYYYSHTLLCISECYDMKDSTVCAGSKMQVVMLIEN